MIEINKVYQGDSAKLMKQIPDNFIDLTVTSPPYDNLRNYKGYSFEFETIAKELYRITKDGGVVVWVVGDETIEGDETGTSFKQTLYFKEIGFKLWDTMIYQKNQYPPNCMSQDRYAQIFEYMFIFSKGKIKTFNRILRENKLAGKKKGKPPLVVQRNGERKRYGANRSDFYHAKIVERNIWIYDVGGASGDGNFKHPAIFPEDLAKDHILSWSNEGDLIFDPFAGSGTTLKMAKLMNRNYLGFEIAEEYIPIINKRLRQETVLAFCPTERIISVKRESADSPNSPQSDNKKLEEANFS